MGVGTLDSSCSEDVIENCVAADGELGVTSAVVCPVYTVGVSVEGILGGELLIVCTDREVVSPGVGVLWEYACVTMGSLEEDE